MAELPSQEYLQSRIDYDPETGEARWKPVDESFGPRWNHFNALRSNKAIGNKPKIFDTVFSKAQILYKLYHGVNPESKVIFKDKNNKNFSIGNLYATEPIKSKNEDFIAKNTGRLPDNLDDILSYNHITGLFTWKPRSYEQFDKLHANKEAGGIKATGYIRISTEGKTYNAHRLAWYMYYGVDPIGYLIDHINAVRHDNNIKNLRLATYSFNTQASYKDAKGYFKTSDHYTAFLGINCTRVYLGTFDTEQEARRAYEEALAKYKPVYRFTPEEQAELDELYQNYPNVTRELQHCCHELQVKALNHYIEGATQ